MKSSDDIIEVVPVDQLDWIYLSYDEPQKEEFWLKLLNIAPWAKRVDGVKGSDRAHKAAAEASETERFILVDGDNLVDPEFVDEQLTITSKNVGAQFRWRARNSVNGLYYGNGGVSSWTRTFVRNMRTHENSLGDSRTNIEFCFDHQYWPMHNCYSTTYPNWTPKQAWRAGFREGVKLCTRSGERPPSVSEFKRWVWPTNLETLTIWQTIGRDVPNGWWSILGARTGTHYLMMRDWDYNMVQDFDQLDRLWELHRSDDEKISRDIAGELNLKLDTDIIEINEQTSRFFKRYVSEKWQNADIMTREFVGWKNQ